MAEGGNVVENKTIGMLNGNHLKLIAALAMLLDHAGLLLFPQCVPLRIVGRLAYPIFAYMIAEGCRYTRNKLRYFGMIFGLGIGCQIVYYFAAGDTYLSILITFCLAILLIYCLQNLQKALVEKRAWILPAVIFSAAVAGVWVLNQYVRIDYGFWGTMTPVLVSLFSRSDKTGNLLPVCMMALGLVCLGVAWGGVQWYALLSLPLLLLYSGKRGKHAMKYFFYLFYPLHLAVLQGISWLFTS